MIRGLLIALMLCLVAPPAAALTKEGFEELENFSRVLHHILEYHVEAPDEAHLLQGAMRGLFQSLDPHSSYLSKRTFSSLQTETGGRFGGVGLEVVLRGGWLTVVAPLDDSPSARARIQAGDRIVKINGQSTKKMNVTQAVEKLRGRPGSHVTVTVLRRRSRVPFNLRLRRETIQVPSVRTSMVEPGYPYVRITSFREQTYRDLIAALDAMAAQGPIKGLILDLRNNPGGLLDQAVKVSDLFLTKGTIVSTESRGKVIDRRDASNDGHEPGYPVAMLVNGGSASAAEIVTGALQDHRRGVAIGSQTFGKGSVQTVIGFEDGSALKLTVARYFTPKNRSIQAFGITPDIYVPAYHPDSEEGRKAAGREGEEKSSRKVSEARLPRHLKGKKGRKQRLRQGLRRVTLPSVSLEESDADYQQTIALRLLQSGQIAKLTRR
jgi:carboxyl-terminal processing protease